MAYAEKCPCGHRACTDWHVGPHAAVQGVRFSEQEAKVLAAVLSGTAIVVVLPDEETALKAIKHINSIAPFMGKALIIGRD